MKKYIQKLFLGCILTCTATPVSQLHAHLITDNLQMAALYAAIALYTTSYNGHLYPHASKIVASTITTLGMRITIDFLVTLMHELGHAVSAKLLTKKDATISMGSYNPNDKTLVTIPAVSIAPRISIQSITPLGRTTCAPATNKLYNTIITASGPLTGFLGGLALTAAYSYITPACMPTTLLQKQQSLYALYRSVESLTNLIPYTVDTQKSDGYVIAEEVCNLPAKHLNRLNSIGSWLKTPLNLLSTYYLSGKFKWSFL